MKITGKRAMFCVVLAAVLPLACIMCSAGTEEDLAEVLKKWDFMPDVSPDEYAPVMTLRGGTELISEGPISGISIKSFPGHPLNVDDEVKGHGAVVRNHPALSPEGAFTIEMWIKPDPEWIRREGNFAEYVRGYLVDKKYIPRRDEFHNDYMIAMRQIGTDWRFEAWLGFGDDSESFNSGRVELEPDKWYHLVFVYDGKGVAGYYLDGEYVGGDEKEGREGITPGRRHLHIGDRVGSYYHGFPGLIDSVRIYHRALEIKPAE